MFILENNCTNFDPTMFYVYEYWSEDVCFYVGKGIDDRYKRHIYYRNNDKIRKTNPHFYNKVSKIIKDDGNILIKIIYSGTENDCFSKEIELITKYGRTSEGTGTLTNITQGGEGTTQPGKRIDQYTKWGEYIRSYDNAKVAMRLNGWPTYSCISMCCRGKESSYKGFLWSYADEKPTLMKKVRPVYQWSLAGKLLYIHNNASIAARTLNYDPSTINDCVNRKINTAKGFLWSVADKCPQQLTSRKTKRVRHVETGELYNTVSETARAFGCGVGVISKCCRTDSSFKSNHFEYC